MNRLLTISVLAIAGALTFEVRESACQTLAVGFEAADADHSGSVTTEEMKKYLAERLRDDGLDFDKIFDQIDADDDDQISPAEFENRHDVIENVMGADYFGGDPMADIEDPGKDFALYEGGCKPTHDGKILGAVTHRFSDLADDESVKWPAPAKLSEIPLSLKVRLAQTKSHSDKPSIDDLANSTVILCGGDDTAFFTAGGVLISEDGLVLTNYHVAEFLGEGKMAAMTTDGKCHPVTKYLAGNQDRDVALIQVAGSNFMHVKIASQSPAIGDNLEMMHHSENRFFTYDRGYVMRYPVLGQNPWMEISADYAPGGSGCGIFNEKRELVGLVSIIQFGDGPSLAKELDMESDAEWLDEGDENSAMQPMDATLMMKHAVPLSAIHSLWQQVEVSESEKRVESHTVKAKRESHKVEK